MLKEGLLAEGGMDEKFGAINASDANASELTQSMRKSKYVVGDTNIYGLPQFEEYADLFKDLTKRKFVDTGIDVIQIIITYDSQFAIAICCESDELFEMQGYSLKTYQQTF